MARHRIARIAWVPARALIRLLLTALGGVSVEGRHHVPRTGPVIFCPNHSTDIDPPAVAVGLPRFARFLAKSELFAMPSVRWAMRLFACIPVKRNSADRAALREAVKTLAEGDPIVIFPEGGGNFDGTLQPLNPGALMIALQSGAPIVPVAIHNAQCFLPYTSTRLRRSPRPLRIVFGPPMHFDDLAGRRDAVAEATRRLTEQLADMLGHPVPDGKPQARD